MSLGAAASTAASAAGDFELDRADQTAAGAAAALQADASMEQQKMVRSKTNKAPDYVDYTAWTTWLDPSRMCAILVAVYLLWMNLIVVPVACLCTLFVFMYPVRLFSLRLFNWLEHELCQLVNDSWTTAARFCGLTVDECGDDIGQYADGRALCLANHLGLADHFVLMTAFHNKGVLAGRYLWVIFNIWRWTPVGAMWTAHGNFFVHGSGVGAQKRQEILDVFRRHLERLYRPFNYGWVVMYPEGSRLFLVQESEKRFCSREGLVPYRHCTHPRVGAAHTVLQVCCEEKVLSNNKENANKRKTGTSDQNQQPFEYIIDCTLGYHRGVVPNFGHASLGDFPGPRSANVVLHHRVHRIRPEWRADPDAFRAWLYEQYALKDQMLDFFYRHGEFPTIEGGVEKEEEQDMMKTKNGGALANGGVATAATRVEHRRPVNVSMFRCLMVQVVWASLFYFHWKFWLGAVLSAGWRLVLALLFS